MAGSGSLVRSIAGMGAAAALLLPSVALGQEGPIRVGILHSLSGTMAISETTLKDVMLMLIDDLNQKGGLLGRPVEAVQANPRVIEVYLGR
jgi:urea transport system substrate-binding protein